jgi:hypothetical protein
MSGLVKESALERSRPPRGAVTPGRRLRTPTLVAAALLLLGLGGARLLQGSRQQDQRARTDRTHQTVAHALAPGGIPRLIVAPPVGEAPRPSDRSLLDGLDPEGLLEVGRVDWSVRRAAFAAAKLSAEETARAEAVYGEADSKWLEVERRADRSTGALPPAAFDELTTVDRQLTIGLMHAIGTPQATTIRRVERREYRRLLQEQSTRAPGSPLAAQVASRRLDQQHYRPQQ